jgi:hypothetical protein
MDKPFDDCRDELFGIDEVFEDTDDTVGQLIIRERNGDFNDE